MKVSFNYNNLTIKETGSVWNNGYVNNLEVFIKNEDNETVYVDREEYSLIEELAEEMLVDKKFNPELGDEE